MKVTLALCLLLAASCTALLPRHPADLASMLSHQQFAMSRMISSFDARADDSTLVNDCFNHYLDDQRDVIVNYNQQYNGCINTAQASRELLTAESASERQSLLDRTNTMCTSLSSCDNEVDGLKFFECYRDSSSDSYKTMFTLNSDSNLDFNRISASYSVIETDLTDCVDTARVTYAHDMDSCDEHLTACLAGDAPVTDAPSTAAPVTDAPSTPAPVTDAPSTPAPVTDAPSTPSPVTDVPSTAAPVTDAPSTPAPVTDAPSTPAPVTDAPSTPAPVTDAPSTPAPVTDAPSTPAPVTDAPSTPAPVTDAPSTPAPVTDAPSTPAPVTDAPSTPAPVTDAPSTPAPVTDAPSTPAPVTDAPSTAAPVTDAPSTPAPVTDAPSTAAPVTDSPSSEAPISTASPTNAPVTEESPNAPEEDLGRALPQPHRASWRLLKRFF